MNKISKIILSVFCGAVCLVYMSENANAAGDTQLLDCTVYSGLQCGASSDVVPIANCDSQYRFCIKNRGVMIVDVYQCERCRPGYILRQAAVALPRECGVHVSGEPEYYTVATCVCECDGRAPAGHVCDCSTGTATWVPASNKTPCLAGTYGPPGSDSDFSRCTDCPRPGTSVSGSNTTIAGCYIPGNTAFYDGSGEYEYDCNCPYNGTGSCNSKV